MEVLVTRMPGKAGDDCPVKPQVPKPISSSRDWTSRNIHFIFAQIAFMLTTCKSKYIFLQLDANDVQKMYGMCYQICRILENDCIGFMVTNEGRDLMTVEKGSQDVAVISVWCNSDLQQHDLERRF